jgi:mono/diheme cytochrome c family protein
MTGHSTSLSARSVSSINPRVIALRLEIGAQPDLVALGFARGEQLLELVSRDYTTGQLAFYVLGFEQACNHAAEGCKPFDLLTPVVEEGWLGVTLYDELDMANTVLDCATCHQPDGPGSNTLLRMQELQSPWTHWFSEQSEGGRALLDDYVAAKGDEPLAGIAAADLLATRPDSLEAFTRSGGSGTQPNAFDSPSIEAVVQASAPAQPVDNSTPGDSPTWRSLFARAQRGEALAVPYLNVKVTDPIKLAAATAAYSAVRTGELPPEALPDVRDVFPDDETRLAQMGMATTPGAAGEAVLLEACALCHNPRLDPSYSRARFRADLVGVSRAEKDEAIRRMLLPLNDPAAMPPPRLRVLSDGARARAIEALER